MRRLSWEADAGVVPGPGEHVAVEVAANEADLAPAQPTRPTRVWEVDQFDGLSVFHRGQLAAAQTRRARSSLFDVDDQVSVGDVVDAEHDHVGQANKQLAHARRVDLQQGLLPESGWRENLPILGAPVPRPVDGQPSLRPRSFAKSQETTSVADGRLGSERFAVARWYAGESRGLDYRSGMCRTDAKW